MSDNNARNWPTIHQSILDQVAIPATKEETAGTTGPWDIRDLCVDLAEVYARIAKAGAHPLSVTIAADVVVVPAGWSSLQLTGTALLITARRLEVSEPKANAPASPLSGRAARITLRYDGDNRKARLLLFVSELSGTLHVVAPRGGSSPTSEFVFSSAPASLGVQIAYGSTEPEQTPLAQMPDDMVAIGTSTRLSLNSVFQMATVLFSSNTTLATDMLNWVKRATASTASGFDLHMQATALLLALTTENVTGFVPSLSRSFYAGQTEDFFGAIDAFNREYERFTDRSLDLADRLKAAKVSLAQYDDAADYAEGLIDQALDNYGKAVAAVESAHHALLTQRDVVARQAAVFEVSLDKWKKDQETAQIIAIVTGVLKLIAGCVGMVAKFGVGVQAMPGDAPTDPTDVGGVGLSPAFQATLRTFEPFRSEYAQYVAQMAAYQAELPRKTFEAFAGFGEAIERVTMAFEAAQAMADAVDKMNSAGSLDASLDLTAMRPMLNPDDPSGDARWQAMQVECDAALQAVIDAGVDGAREYKVAIDLEVIYGRAVNTCQMAVIRTAQELVRLRLQKQMANAQKARMQSYIDAMATDAAPVAQLAQEMFERTLDIKRWFYLSIMDYKKAYEYWALRSSLVTPSVVKSVPELKADLSTITREYGLALKSFKPPPQPFKISRSFTDSTRLNEFRQGGSVVCPISLSDPAFAGRSRVRIRTLRAWLVGATFTGSLDLMLSNAGSYADRLGPKTFSFVSEPLKRGFSYQAPGTIVLDGTIFDEEQYAYFMPTPFTDWTIALAPNSNPSLVLSGLQEIRMEFEGSAILL